jgi:hypothetical protein
METPLTRSTISSPFSWCDGRASLTLAPHCVTRFMHVPVATITPLLVLRGVVVGYGHWWPLVSIKQDYCSFGSTSVSKKMDSATFMKLARECDLVSRACPSSDVDLIFNKVRPHLDTSVFVMARQRNC